MADVSYEIDSNGIAVVTWDLEDRSMNVLNLRSIAEYKEIIEKCIKDDLSLIHISEPTRRM